MSTSKRIGIICVICALLACVVCVAMYGLRAATRAGESAGHQMGYEKTLFDTSKVHTIDIVMDDWDEFIANCENEEYATCAVVVDGESCKNVAIRAKGNTSLSNVKQLDSERYSFKIEFDHYESGKTYRGLDKLSLNNLIQDNTYMKDYLTYSMMNQFGVDSPLASYAYITVNGEDWGLYLAVEGVEDSFLERVYGSDTGELYKPDSMSFGGGRGNGREFDLDEFLNEQEAEQKNAETEVQTETPTEAPSEDQTEIPSNAQPEAPSEIQNETPNMPTLGAVTQTASDEATGATESDGTQRNRPSRPGNGSGDSSSSGQDARPNFSDAFPGGDSTSTDDGSDSSGDKGFGGKGGFGGMGGFGGFGGMGSADVRLQYIDDDPDSYANIFDNAKTDVTLADKKRLIESLRKLSACEGLENTLDMDKVLRYFVVHDYVCNGDSYTGTMVHNYYLHENDGKLSMIPWDYNLAFGGFNGGDATTLVNSPIDDPTSSGFGRGGFARREEAVDGDSQEVVDESTEDTGEGETAEDQESDDGESGGDMPQMPEGMPGGDMPQMPEGMEAPDGDMPQMPGGEMPQMPEGMEAPSGDMPSFMGGQGFQPQDGGSSQSSDSRPMVDWIFSDERYTQAYHELYQQFLNEVDVQSLINQTAELIAPYVERDPTKFCTYEEFQTGVDTLRSFCALRSQSVQAQLDGVIPSTAEGQQADSSALIDASEISISSMGSMGNGGGPRQGQGRPSGEGADGGGLGIDQDGSADGGANAPSGGFAPPGSGPGGSGSSGSSGRPSGGPNFPGGPSGSFEAPEGMPTGFGSDASGESFGGVEPPGDLPSGLVGGGQMVLGSPSTWIALGASFVVLLAGFAITFLFRRP